VNSNLKRDILSLNLILGKISSFVVPKVPFLVGKTLNDKFTKNIKIEPKKLN
jgi:hypothetical protein